jgi:hypothetical protein
MKTIPVPEALRTVNFGNGIDFSRHPLAYSVQAGEKKCSLKKPARNYFFAFHFELAQRRPRRKMHRRKNLG